MNHINEYRLFKGRKTVRRPSMEVDDDPYTYSKVDYHKQSNIFDPEEPFFNWNKGKYIKDKEDRMRQASNVTNQAVGSGLLKKMKVSQEDLDRVKSVFDEHWDVKWSNPYLYKDEDSISLSAHFYHKKYKDFSGSITLKYFIPEDDYMAYSSDYNGKSLRKIFKTSTEAFDWLIEVFNNRKSLRRSKVRSEVSESNEPGLDVFNLKGIDKKLNNLLGFDDFEKTFKPKEQKSTKRTEVGLDIINERKTKK